ncbi:polysaccharide biosynthesis protein [Chryseobacterium shigense]|uniref:Membrane protein involved in the export of O-antigen and teichoic acid n=1 Tax=Chryseobacterium shigense TaxID=297244 RepID=A0A1N7I8J5_9FLAO|nr:oligosaccharide flippase family protein [Chryseobacterium shigense]PQA96962.1 polysaccharide biosynthesis protein [Chryseobacterium shigense]SIS33397.1 Membrane protein involved in the export of O-antigen and teichoic acid [Chryseobacterium shigense]
MSVVARQGFKYSIIGYIGFLLGTFSIFIFTNNLEFYGTLRYIMPTAEMLVPFVVFGISYSNVKFFNKVDQDGKRHNMLSLSLAAVFINFILFLVVFFLLPYIFPGFKNMKAWKIKEIILPLTLMLSFCAIFNKYISNYKRIVVSNIFDNLFPKIANLGAFLIFISLVSHYPATSSIPEKTALLFFFGMFFLMFIGYIFYTNKLEKIQFDFSTGYFKKDHFYKEFAAYSFFGFLGTFGNYLAINNFMIGEFLGMEEVGIYSILYALISLISVPQLGLFNISAPIISKALADRDMDELDRFHKKTSLSLYFLGAVLFSCIMVGFPYLTHFMPKNGVMLREYEPVVWIWGSAVLVDLATGFNGNIISLSRYYKFNILVMLLLAGLTIGLNFYFLKNTDLKLIGVALSTAISLTTYNVVKIVFNYFVFKVSPLTIEMIFVSIICTLAITVAIVLPTFHNNFINLVYKPAVVLVLIYIGNHFTKVFPIENYVNAKFIKSIFKFK